ncbi:MAG TPA: hypothetical protein VLE95_07565 [Chlamydiales bacterium]|nr:hypothetical protein [Chlamydiales bacterium]
MKLKYATLVIAASHLFGAELLDQEMSAQDQKTTGLYKLTSPEKAALQQWINAHYQKKTENTVSTTPSTTPTKGGVLTLSENLMSSQYLRLSDGTLWNVRPEDVPIAQGWITPVEIQIGQSSHPFYPFKLTNKVSGSSVLTRKANALPKPGSPPLSPPLE